MDERSKVMQKFGPKLIEGMLLLLLDEINILRLKADLPPRTLLQLFNQMTNHFSDLPDYDWQEGFLDE